MKNVAIIYYSGYGHTEVIAKAVERGARKSSVVTSIRINDSGKIGDLDWQVLDAADAIIFGTPTYMGSAAGPFKMWMDQTSKLWAERKWSGKVAGGFTNSHSYSGDKSVTLIQLVTLAAQHGMVWVGQDAMASGKGDGDVNRIGSYLGVMAQSENEDAARTPPSGDIKTAELYGERIASIANRFTKP